MQLLKIGVATQFLCHDSISVLVIVATLFLVLSEFMSRPRKFVTTEFYLISCCNFILMLRHGLLVLLMFAVATQFVML